MNFLVDKVFSAKDLPDLLPYNQIGPHVEEAVKELLGAEQARLVQLLLSQVIVLKKRSSIIMVISLEKKAKIELFCGCGKERIYYQFLGLYLVETGIVT